MASPRSWTHDANNLQVVQLAGSVYTVRWEVEYTDQFEIWWESLAEEDQDRIAAAVRLLASHGPSLGRPAVDQISGSRHANMKELELEPPGHFSHSIHAEPPSFSLEETSPDCGTGGTKQQSRLPMTCTTGIWQPLPMKETCDGQELQRPSSADS